MAKNQEETCSSQRKIEKEEKLKSGQSSIDLHRKKPVRKRPPYLIRLLTEVPAINPEDTPGCECVWPNLKSDPQRFQISLVPSDGLWKDAKIQFRGEIPTDYPNSPPKIHCETRLYHPNIDLSGNVCLNILKVFKEDGWKPVLGISHVLFGLMTLFIDPNPNDPLNHEAAQLMINNEKQFEKNVNDALRGGYVSGCQFPKLL